MVKTLVLLSGCGKNDGSEIHEAVFALLAIDQAGATYDICAPDAPQTDVVNHQTGEVSVGEVRNMRVESARIARGPVLDAHDVKATDYDALILPGGFGAAKNLCSFATEGPECSVNSDAESLVTSFHRLKKPIGAICIAPALVAKVLGQGNLTIGTDEETASALEKTGCHHIKCAVGDIVVDDELNLVSTPAYMLGQHIKDVHQGIDKLVKEVVKRAQTTHSARA